MTDAAPDPILQFFVYSHLPVALKDVSRPFCDLALHVTATTPRNPERTVALRKLLEAKDAAVRASLFVGALLCLLPSVAFAQAAAAPSPVAGFFAQFLTPAGIATIVGTIASILFGLWKLSDLRKKQVATAAYHAFHLVEDLSGTTETTVDDKVAAGLKALDAYMLAQGWRPAKPGEQEVAKLEFSALNGAAKAAEKIQTAAIVAAGAPEAKPTPSLP